MNKHLKGGFPRFVRAAWYLAHSWTGRSRLSASQRELLALMRRDNSEAGAPFNASAMWGELSRQFDKVMQVEGIGVVETQFYNTMFAQSIPTNPRYYRYALWMLYCNIKQRDRLNILGRVSATVGRDTGLAYVFEGNLVSWDLLTSIDTLYAISEVYPAILTEPVVVADLGAGWGRIGYVLKKVNPICTYVALDLPEPLLISMTRLPQLLPDEQVVGYHDIRTMPSISKKSLIQGGLWFCGSQDLARFDDWVIDVFVNIASFQEMTRDQVTAYFRLIDRKVEGVFYAQEYWAHPDLHARYGVIGGFEEYPFPPCWQRLYVRNSTFSERYFEVAFAINQ